MNETTSLILRELNEGDEQAFYAGLEDWKNEALTWFTFVWQPGMSFKEHLTILEKQKDKESLDVGRVPSTMLYAFVGTNIVGRLSVRHELNKGLLERGGHLGYAVSPKYRRSGYASAIYKQGLQFCQKLGLEKILITCSDENIPSWKVIEKLPAHLENRFYDQSKNEFVRRYWITITEALNPNIQITDKVVAYITRTHLGCADLLVFDHDQKYSDAGTQVPSGTVEANENIKASLLREIKEETGLSSKFEIQKIDEYVFYADGSKKYVRRHVYQLNTKSQLPDKWTHIVSGHGEDCHLNFHFFWLKIEDAKGKLSVRFDDSIFKMNPLK